MANSYNEELSIGDRIGRYEILSVLGSGSMGMVYKCRHDVLGRIVAIKTLRLQRTTDDRTQKRFIREAQMANRLNHPNLIGLVDFGNMANNDPYLVMEFVSGQSLYEIMKRERYLIPERAVALFSQVADGLYHAHQRGVIHRDLKPANMLVVKNEDGSETVKIVDLGVAKIVHGSEDEEAEAITMTGEVCGSPIYLSPEQCMYQELDARTDIYSLGVCLYECLTGTPPLRGATVYDTIYMHVHDTPRPFHQVAVNPDIPKRLEEVVLRCLAKQPKDRYDTMIHLKKELIDSLKPQSASNSGVKVLPPEQLFSGANAAPKRPPEPPGAGTAPGQQSADGPVREFGKTSGKQSTDAAPAEESENRNSKISKKMAAAAEPAVKSPEELSKAATKSKKQGSKKKSDGSGFGGKLASMGLDSVNPKTIGLLASMALVFFGFGSVFAYFLLKSTTNPTPPVVSSQTAAPDSTTAATNAVKQSPSTTASAAPKASAFVEPDIAGAPITPEPGLLDRANALPFSVVKPQVKPQAAAKSPAASKAPQQPLSFNQMNNLLDSTDGSQSRFNSIVEQVPSHPVSQKSKQHGTGNSANPYRQYTHLKAGRHLPPARPMPVLRRTAFNSGGQMGGPMGGMGGPMGGMGGPMGGMGGPMGGMGGPMGGMGGPMGGMGGPMGGMGGPMGGMGGNPMGGPMGGMGGNPMGGMGGNPMGAQGGGHGGGLLAKIQDFIASQSGGTIPPSGGNQNGGMGGMNGGASGGNNVMEQQAALSKEGTQLCESHQFAAACQKYEQAYKLNPGNMEVNQMYAYALNSYAVQLNKQGKYKEAVQYEKRAVSLYPDNQRYNNNLHNFSENAKNQAAGAL